MLRGSGLDSGTVALGRPSAGLGKADWLPLLVEKAPLSEVQTSVEMQLARAQEDAAMAADLFLRDAELIAARPDIALTFDGGFQPQSAVTLILDASKPALSYDATRLSVAAAELLAHRLNAAFAAFATAETAEDVWALPQPEEALQRETWNATDRVYDRSPIHTAFEARAAATPDAPALVFETQTLTYAALNARANQLAHVLRAKGTTPGTPIGLCTSRSVDLLVGALGILKAGGAYVPLDPAYPADRIAHYISDSAAPLIVTQSALAGTLPDHSAQVVEIDTDPALNTAPDTNPEATATADDLAYLIGLP